MISLVSAYEDDPGDKFAAFPDERGGKLNSKIVYKHFTESMQPNQVEIWIQNILIKPSAAVGGDFFFFFLQCLRFRLSFERAECLYHHQQQQQHP